MELDIELNLAEAAMQLGTSVEKLIQFGAHGDLTISVVAKDWPVQAESETAETISELVNLVPSDLLQSYVAEIVVVHKVVTADENETVTLANPVEVLRGLLYVTAEEFRRFRDKHGSAAGRTEGLPPYLDSSHSLKSPLLAIAIQAWLALFADGTFDPKGRAVKYRIEHWLAKNHGELSASARENIATLINPEIYKDGGTPRTPGE
jgi:hypothetical protein